MARGSDQSNDNSRRVRPPRSQISRMSPSATGPNRRAPSSTIARIAGRGRRRSRRRSSQLPTAMPPRARENGATSTATTGRPSGPQSAIVRTTHAIAPSAKAATRAGVGGLSLAVPQGRASGTSQWLPQPARTLRPPTRPMRTTRPSAASNPATLIAAECYFASTGARYRRRAQFSGVEPRLGADFVESLGSGIEHPPWDTSWLWNPSALRLSVRRR